MAGTARMNPRSDPILPLPNPSREGFRFPPMMGNFQMDASMEHHRALQEQRQRQRQQQEQQRRELSLKRSRSLRDDMERERAASLEQERMDRMLMMERERMKMDPPHRMIYAGPSGTVFKRDRTPTASLDGRTIDGPAGISNGHVVDGRSRMEGPTSIGDHLHRMNGPAGIGNGYRMDGPIGIGESPSSILHMGVGALLGSDNAAGRVLDNHNLIDRRLKGVAERRSIGLENATDWGLENSRLMERRLESRERRLENSAAIESRSESSMEMDRILENPTAMERRSETLMGMERRVENPVVMERRSESIAGMVRRLDRTVTVMERSSETLAHAPSMERRTETISGIQRRVESPVKLLDRRLEAISPEPDDYRVGSRLHSVRLPSLDRGRSVEWEHEEDREITKDGSREDDSQMERPVADVAMQELVAQYKMALAELTFNSKPIITNLTIIAGENLHASKLIASTVCAHILEVPVEQKLPSLYLLDSIVKNIGNEYVKHFSARLPEVFIKSYRQVDPSLHAAMQHLFKTWRGVFTMELLGKIETELHLNIIGNAAPSSAALPTNTTRTDDSSPQQPGHSIHVNPKYLEEQGQMQQSRQVYLNHPQGDIGSFDQGNEGGEKCEGREKLWDRDWPREEDSLRPPESGSIRYGLRNGFEPSQLSPQALVDGYGNIRGIRAPRLPPAPVQPTQDLDNRMHRGPARNWKKSEEEEYAWEEVDPRLFDANSHSGDSSRNVTDNWYLRDGYKNELPGALSAGKPFGLDQPISDHSVWHKHGASIPYPMLETPLLGSIARSMTGHPSHPFPEQHSPHSQSKLRFLQVSQDAPPSALGSQASMPAPLSSSGQATVTGPSTTCTTVPQNLVSLLPPPNGVLNLGSLSLVTPMSGLKQLQRPPSPSPLITSSSRLHVPLPPLNPPFPHQLNLPSLHPSKSAHRQGQVWGMQPHLSQQSMPLHPLQQPPLIQQLPQQQSESIHQPPLRNTSCGETLSHQPADVSDEQPRQTVPQIPSQLLESLQQLRHHLPPLLGGLPQASKPAFLYSLPSQPAQSPPRPVLQENVLPEVLIQQRQLSIQAPPTSMGSVATNPSALLSGSQNRNNSSIEVVPNLSADFLQSGLGLMPLTVQAQPPLPSGPPPVPYAALGSNVLPGQSAPLAVSTSTSYLLPVASLPLPPAYASSRNLQPPLPPGPRPIVSQVASSTSQSPPSAGPSVTSGNNYTSCLSSLMAQGIISAPPSAPILPQPVGAGSFSAPLATIMSTTLVTALRTQEPSFKATFTTRDSDTLPSDPSLAEFKQEVLRERQEFVITALYSAFPMQCTICGVRFKHQEEHNKHMDWHASRNRQLKSLKKVSRRWFVSVKEWLNGTEAAASEVIPAFFPEDLAVKPEEEQEVVVVPADENQITCFLCGEPFEDFYSDETEEWMYRGAVYMNASRDGSMEGLDIVLQGPIVHAKCRSESSVSTVANSLEDVELVNGPTSCCL